MSATPARSDSSNQPTSASAGPSRRPSRPTFEQNGLCVPDNNTSYAYRSPKRARNSPSPKDEFHFFIDKQDYDRPSSSSQRHARESSSIMGTPSSLHPHLSVALPSSKAGYSPSSRSNVPNGGLGIPLDWPSSVPMPQPSLRQPRLQRERSLRNPRRREMSVPLLSQSLSSFSLSHSSLPPMGSDLSLDGPGRASSSSTPPLTTPIVTNTPRRVPHLRRLQTPAPLLREIQAPNTVPAIPPLLGSPFDAKRPFTFDVASPWPGPKEDSSDWQTRWADPSSSPTLLRRPRRGSSSDDGSCASTAASVSTERHSVQAAHPSVVSVWDEEGLSPTTPLRPLCDPKSFTVNSRTQQQLGTTSDSWVPESPMSGQDSPVQLRHGRHLDEVSPSTNFTRFSKPRGDKRPSSCLVDNVDALLPRRQSEPDSTNPDVEFAAFLARCSGERETKSEFSTRREAALPALDSSPVGLGLDMSSPLSKPTLAALPPWAKKPAGLPSSSSAPTLPTLPLRPRRGSFDHAPSTTPVRSSAKLARPELPRRSTTGAPQLSTPVSQLFGDDKPSPAAFASTGLVKKRGGKAILPQFKELFRRRWTPVNAEDTPSKETASSSKTIQAEDWDEYDQLSPIKPLKSRPGPSHARVPSTAESTRSTHARKLSTASSIGSRGLRRKGSAMFTSGSIGSDSDKGSPATPTKHLPFAAVQAAKLGFATPSPTVSSSRYPFDRRMSFDGISPNVTPTAKGRLRALSRGPIPRASNPMLSAAYRNQAVPQTPVDSSIPEGFAASLARIPSSGRFGRDFTLVQALGTGEFSSVWKVRHRESGELFAVKAGKAFTGQKSRQRQREEVMALRELSRNGGHPHIVKYIDSWEQDDQLYIRTEVSECGDLSKYLGALGDLGGLGEGRVWKVLVEISTALEYIHSHGILHLDLKPSNVLLTNEGSLKVADFGMSVFQPGRMPEDWDGLVEGDVFFPRELLDRDHEGDREYLCPEALMDREPGPEADIFSLGMMTLEAALNVALPSNGDAWVKLRDDDYSDIDDHYVERGKDDVLAFAATAPGDPPPPVVSGVLVNAIKRMMASSPLERMTLAELGALDPMTRARAAMSTDTNEPGGTGWRAGPALADEDNGWIEYVLGEQ